MNITEYIVREARNRNVSHFFGIPGDFAIPFFANMSRLNVPLISLTHEPGLGYAADAYARLRGLSVVFVTYGAGALNMVNSIAQAYAENSPVLVISGAPEQATQDNNLMVHHKVKSFDSQLHIFSEVCHTSIKIRSISEAPKAITQTMDAAVRELKPCYIEIPRNLLQLDIPEFDNPKEGSSKKANDQLEKALKEIHSELQEKISEARNPLILAGAEILRKGLQFELEKLVNHLSVPFLTSFDGKSAADETHPLFAGSFMGDITEETNRLLQESDLLIILGAIESDMNTGFTFRQTDKTRQIHAVQGNLHISYHQYMNIPLGSLLKLLSSLKPGKWKKTRLLPLKQKNYDFSGKDITTGNLIALINRINTQSQYRIIMDVCDLYFNMVDLRIADIMAPGYYASMGFAVPAAIASSLADPFKRPLVFVGDGAFQMTGAELSVLKKYGLNPIIIVLNNDGYETMRNIDEDREIYKIPEWNYSLMAKSMGVESAIANDMLELMSILEKAENCEEAFLIEARVNKEVKSKVSKKIRRLIHKKLAHKN